MRQATVDVTKTKFSIGEIMDHARACGPWIRVAQGLRADGLEVTEKNVKRICDRMLFGRPEIEAIIFFAKLLPPNQLAQFGRRLSDIIGHPCEWNWFSHLSQLKPKRVYKALKQVMCAYANSTMKGKE